MTASLAGNDCLLPPLFVISCKVVYPCGDSPCSGLALRTPCEKPLRKPQVLKIEVVCAAFREAGSPITEVSMIFLFFPGVSYLYRYISSLLILVCILNIVSLSSKSTGFGGLQVTRVSLSYRSGVMLTSLLSPGTKAVLGRL